MTGLTFFENFFLCVCSNNSILWTGVELVLQVKRYLGLNQPQWEREHRLAFPFFFFSLCKHHPGRKCKFRLSQVNHLYQTSTEWWMGVGTGAISKIIFSPERWGQLCAALSGRVDKGRDCLGLFALKEVETSHVLLQRFNAKSVAVLGVESSFLFDRCGCVLPFSPILRGTEAVPLWLVLKVNDTGE